MRVASSIRTVIARAEEPVNVYNLGPDEYCAVDDSLGWICDHLEGRYALPDRAAMLADMEAERAAMFARYVPSKRHTMQVDFEDYVLAAKQERRRGGRRAA